MKRRIYRWVLAGCVLAFTAAGLAGGCSSSTLPPKLSLAEQARVRATHFPCTLGVERYVRPAYSARLIASLRGTGLFDRVEALDEVPDAPMVARVQTEIYGNAVIPLFTCLSLGFIPTITHEQHGHAFTLAPRCCPEKAVPLDFRYSGPTTLGWFAVLQNLGPNNTSKSPYGHPRFHDGLANVVSLHASEIGIFAERHP